jgi:hypothetical protein
MYSWFCGYQAGWSWRGLVVCNMNSAGTFNIKYHKYFECIKLSYGQLIHVPYHKLLVHAHY